MKTLEIYSRQGCHLCEVMIDELLPLVRGRFEIVVHDIDTREDWKRKYDTRIPVLKYDGKLVCQYHLDRESLARILNSTPNETNS